MDRGSWWVAVHRVARVRHECSDLACVHTLGFAACGLDDSEDTQWILSRKD